MKEVEYKIFYLNSLCTGGETEETQITRSSRPEDIDVIKIRMFAFISALLPCQKRLFILQKDDSLK